MIPIPYPDLTIEITGMFIVFAIGVLGMVYLTLKFDTMFSLSPLIPMVAIIILLGTQVTESTHTWEKQVSNQIDIASCDDLKSLYSGYNPSSVKETIKLKYIFDCVADKQSLELFK